MDNLNNDDVSTPTDELTILKERATQMGIKFHPSIGVESLRQKVNAVLQDKMTVAQANADTGGASNAPAAPVVEEPKVETEHEKRLRMRKEMLKLVRVRITCMNPAKKEWEGEIFTVANRGLGTIKRYIPFNAQDEGWHVEQILLQMLQERECQTFYNAKSKNGVTIRKGRMIKEFAIEVLPPLSEKELHDLAQRQAMAQSLVD